MEKPLWKFSDNQATFLSDTANQLKTLYFPLCNLSPFMSALSPDLHGDIKTDFNHFLMQPVSRIDLTNLKSSRNFWIYINPQKIWSATGVSKDIAALKNDRFRLEAGLLWHKITRQNKKIGIEAEISSFVPASGEPVEIMQVKLTNISSRTIKFIPTAAIPIFARSLHNLFDHRQVTSLLMRVKKEKFGVCVTPTLVFDEKGHRKNTTTYFVLGFDQNCLPPEYFYPSQEEFCGESSDLEAPAAVFENYLPDIKYPSQGKEAMGALRFRAKTLKSKASYSYILLLGIVKAKKEIKPLFNKFNSPAKIENALAQTKAYWQQKSQQILTQTGDNIFDGWLRWVNIQPLLRRIFGCSFLPDFDYGKGGRGWRDLWQDCLALILSCPEEVKPLLISNFSGVRIDGSNATIIGQNPGDFIADRNNIPRVWMDHGIWPLLTTLLYIQQTGNLDILFQETDYFADHLLSRSRKIDSNWTPACGNKLKTKSQGIYRGTILEHILIQNLVPFFNVGPHNHIRLEGADWNDALDMAAEFGESVAFTALYAQNLKDIAALLKKLNLKNLTLLKELALLFDSLNKSPLDYADINAKQNLLKAYFTAVNQGIDGEKISLSTPEVIADLEKKANWLSGHIRKNEWVKPGFFNGYYDNRQARVEGKINRRLRMTLAGQVFAVTSGVANQEQIKILFKNAKEYLQDPKLLGFRLNTDFKAEQLNLGRAFSFIYGDKENGACFNHMSVMFAYGLYKQGFARQGYAVINSIYRMSIDTPRSKIYPGLPEYFNAQGRGMYSYLTGSASWYLFTLLTQVFGIRGEYGDLVIEPKLLREQFKNRDSISIASYFAGKRIEVSFINPRKKDFGEYKIRRVALNQKVIAEGINQTSFSFPRKELLNLAGKNPAFRIILD